MCAACLTILILLGLITLILFDADTSGRAVEGAYWVESLEHGDRCMIIYPCVSVLCCPLYVEAFRWGRPHSKESYHNI
jgi:hypothetical protein